MTREALEARIAALVDRLADGSRDDDARDALLAELADYQAANVVPYGRLRNARAKVEAIPALPTDVYRFARVAAHPPELDVRVFRTSGTTNAERGQHPFRSLALYDRAARAAAKHMLFPDRERMRLAILAPHESELPDSSLSYMLSRFEEWFGTETTWVFRGGALDLEALARAVDGACAVGEPLALLGTSFAFVHADDGLGERRFALPHGSRIMQTGGFKGRSRTVEPEAMRALLASRYGVPEDFVVAEYGMTELSSQTYETTLRDALLGTPAPRRLWHPGWMRATPVDPETLREVPEGEVGLLRLDDAANLDSCAFVQTSDLARREGDGFVLLGRAPGAVPRGCSIAADEALGR